MSKVFTFDEARLERLKAAIRAKGMPNAEGFTGASGRKEIMKVNLDPLLEHDPLFIEDVGHLLVQLYISMFKGMPDAIGGPSKGGELVCNAFNRALEIKHIEPLPVFNAPKNERGTVDSTLTGFAASGADVLLLDDVLNRGGSLERTLAGVHARGMKASAALCILCRHQSGLDALFRKEVTPLPLIGIADVLTPENLRSWRKFYGTAPYVGMDYTTLEEIKLNS